MTTFIGILDGAGDVWGVRIPDVPGCVGAGATPDEAITDAGDALREVTAYKQRCGYGVPAPSSLEDILATGEIAQGETVVMLPLVLDEGRTVRANLTFDAGLLNAIDEEARRRGVTRSAFLAGAARDKLLPAPQTRRRLNRPG